MEKNKAITKTAAGAEEHLAEARCPVCRSERTRFFLTVGERDYRRCDACRATMLNAGQYPAPEAERAEYEKHQNSCADAGYRKFLSRLADPLLLKLSPGETGLDYGCGSAPALAEILREAGMNVFLYDPNYFPARQLLGKRYDFITCSEVIEHFHRPAEEFEKFDSMLRPGGRLAVMTCFQTDDESFAAWHYVRDITHVMFYREYTLERIAGRFGWSIEFPTKDVALMQKARDVTV